MSELTNQPVGLYPEDRERIRRIQAAKPELKNTSALVRFAIQDLDERIAKRQKAAEPDDMVLMPGRGLVPASAAAPALVMREGVVDDLKGGRINDLLGGIMRGAIVLLVGAAATGKSTAAAEQAAQAARQWADEDGAGLARCPIYWLSRDTADVVRERFANDGSGDVFDLCVRVFHAIANVPLDARTVVIDDLERWGRFDDQVAIMSSLRRHGAWLKIVVRGVGAKGDRADFADYIEIERAADATVVTEHIERAVDATVVTERKGTEYTLRFTNRRWTPCASWVARHVPAPPSASAEPPVAPKAPKAPKARRGAAKPKDGAPDGATRLRVAMKGMAANAFDKVAKVGRGTTGKVLGGKTSLESAGRGKLLKLVEKLERDGAT
jgi:hypothetical protein